MKSMRNDIKYLDLWDKGYVDKIEYRIHKCYKCWEEWQSIYVNNIIVWWGTYETEVDWEYRVFCDKCLILGT